MARRFFVDKDNLKINNQSITITGDEVHHINVLRHKVNDSILINNYIVRIKNMSQDKLEGVIEKIEENNSENMARIKLYQSYLKSDKMEFIVQKAVELGISDIIPFMSKNCVVKLDNKDRNKKLERLNKISMEASKQCGREDIVRITKILNISDSEFTDELDKNTINILAYENSQNSLKEAINRIKNEYNDISIGIIIGPEGGFDKVDLEIFNSVSNVCEVSLGKNILRAETATINLLSIINYELNG